MTPFEAKGWTKEDRFRWSDTSGEWRIEDDDASVAPWFRSTSGRGAYIDLSQLTKIEDDAMSDGATEMLRDEQIKMNPGDWVDAKQIETQSKLFAIRSAVRGMGYRVSSEGGNWEGMPKPEEDAVLMLDRDGDLVWTELDKGDGCDVDLLKLLELGGYFRGQYARDHSVPLEQADEAEWIDARMEQATNYDSGHNEGFSPLPSPYHRLINGAVIDVYDILHAYRDAIGNPALEHAIKKALVPGGRGHKSREQDLREIQWSVKRAIDLEAD
jgi:hypothetical protein